MGLGATAGPLGGQQALPTPGVDWRQYATPEDAGWSAARLDSARAFASGLGSATLLVVSQGHVVTAWGPIDVPLNVYSVRKSLVSALYGVFQQKGSIDLDATLRELGVNDLASLTDAEAGARIRDLLTAQSGIYLAAAYEPGGTSARRPPRGSQPPGSRWWYNNWDFNALGGILEQQTGRDLFEAFRNEIAEPLGMQDFRLSDTFEWLEPTKSRFPAHLFRLSARDLARFGQLYLARGSWHGRQVLPASWVDESTAPHASQPNGRNQYGYMWWVNRGDPAAVLTVERYGRYTARGNGGQQILVIPALDLVLVHQVDLEAHPEVPFTEMQKLFSMILDARHGSPVAVPRLTTVRPQRLGAPPSAKAISRDAGIPRELLDAVVGDYVMPPADSVTLFRHDNRLFLRDDGLEVELLAREGGGFHSTWYPVVVDPGPAGGGRITQLVVHVSGARAVASRIGP